MRWFSVSRLLRPNLRWLEWERPPETRASEHWSPVVRAVGEGLGSVDLLEEVCYWGEHWGFQNSCHSPLSVCLSYLILCFVVFVSRHELSATDPTPVCAATFPSTMATDSPCKTVGQNKLFLLEVASAVVSYHSNWEVTKAKPDPPSSVLEPPCWLEGETQVLQVDLWLPQGLQRCAPHSPPTTKE